MDSNINLFSQFCKSWSIKSFRQNVGQLHICIDVGDVNSLFFLQSANEIKFNIDVFRSLMKLRILNKLD